MDSRVATDNPAVCSPHLKKVLKSYQMTSMRSLNGPDTRSVYGLNYSLPEKDMSSPLLTQFAVTNSSPHSPKNSVNLSSGDEVYYKKRHKGSGGFGSGSGAAVGGGVAVVPSSNPSSTSSVGKAKFRLLNMTGDTNNNNNISSEASSTSANNNIKNTSSKLESSGMCKSNGTAENGGGSEQFGDERESFENDLFLGPPPFPIQQVPILTAPDQGWTESKTLLEGEMISCFVVGGEKRLCLPQILNTVLRNFSLSQINAVCDEMQIYCSRCNQEQLDVLKVAGVLPVCAPSCGLVTKTDCERLCNALLHRYLPRAQHYLPPEKRPYNFRIYHECFGRCEGIYTPDHFTIPDANCIECVECHCLMSPQRFVGHVHRFVENRTCHWGFDSMNWRFYVLVAKGQDMSQLKNQLDEMKDRFDNTKNNQKRKQSRPTQIKAEAIEVDDEEGRASGQHVSMGDEEDEEVKEDAPVIKKRKSEVTDTYFPYVYDPVGCYYGLTPPGPYPHHANSSALSRLSAFRPWSPILTTKEGKYNLNMPPNTFVRDGAPPPPPLPAYISRGPPVLLHPERVVPLSETERFERHYQPNVALAPPSAQIQAKQKFHQSRHANESSPSNVQRTSLNLSNRPKPQLSPVNSNNRITSSVLASSTSTSSLSRTQPPVQLRTYNEFDLSTDTDETFSDSTTYSTSGSPSLCNTRTAVPDSPQKPPDDVLLTEMKQLHEVLDGSVPERDVREKVLNCVARICYSLERKLEKAELSNKQLQQDLELEKMTKRKQLQDLETKRLLRKEIDRLMHDQIRQEILLKTSLPVSSSLHNRRIVLKQEQIDDDEPQCSERMALDISAETIDDASDTQEEPEEINQQSVDQAIDDEEVEDVKPNVGLLQASVSSGY